MQVKERNTNLDEMLFKVKLQDLFANIDESGKSIKIPGKKALLNAENNYPISIVSNDYEIITNEVAYNYGIKCLKSLFKLSDKENIEIFHIHRPATLSFCHIDLTSKTRAFNFKGDKYFPFIRITNSYNKMFKLYFRVGVCRSICENGMIFGDNSIRFSYNHMKSASENINFDIKKDALEKILEKFKNSIEILSNKRFNFEFLFPMIYKGLGIAPRKQPMNEKQKENADEMDRKILKLSEIYKKQIGENFYSIYNIITDISTRGIDNESFGVTRIHHRQLRAGRWMAEISDLLRKNEFYYEKYLEEYLVSNKN